MTHEAQTAPLCMHVPLNIKTGLLYPSIHAYVAHLFQNFHGKYVPRGGARYLPNLKHLEEKKQYITFKTQLLVTSGTFREKRLFFVQMWSEEAAEIVSEQWSSQPLHVKNNQILTSAPSDLAWAKRLCFQELQTHMILESLIWSKLWGRRNFKPRWQNIYFELTRVRKQMTAFSKKCYYFVILRNSHEEKKMTP